jgi:hypothetical protein
VLGKAPSSFLPDDFIYSQQSDISMRTTLSQSLSQTQSLSQPKSQSQSQQLPQTQQPPATEKESESSTSSSSSSDNDSSDSDDSSGSRDSSDSSNSDSSDSSDESEKDDEEEENAGGDAKSSVSIQLPNPKTPKHPHRKPASLLEASDPTAPSTATPGPVLASSSTPPSVPEPPSVPKSIGTGKKQTSTAKQTPAAPSTNSTKKPSPQLAKPQITGASKSSNNKQPRPASAYSSLSSSSFEVVAAAAAAAVAATPVRPTTSAPSSADAAKNGATVPVKTPKRVVGNKPTAPPQKTPSSNTQTLAPSSTEQLPVTGGANKKRKEAENGNSPNNQTPAAKRTKVNQDTSSGKAAPQTAAPDSTVTVASASPSRQPRSGKPKTPAVTSGWANASASSASETAAAGKGKAKTTPTKKNKNSGSSSIPTHDLLSESTGPAGTTNKDGKSIEKSAEKKKAIDIALAKMALEKLAPPSPTSPVASTTAAADVKKATPKTGSAKKKGAPSN